MKAAPFRAPLSRPPLPSPPAAAPAAQRCHCWLHLLRHHLGGSLTVAAAAQPSSWSSKRRRLAPAQPAKSCIHAFVGSSCFNWCCRRQLLRLACLSLLFTGFCAPRALLSALYHPPDALQQGNASQFAAAQPTKHTRVSRRSAGPWSAAASGFRPQQHWPPLHQTISHTSSDCAVPNNTSGLRCGSDHYS